MIRRTAETQPAPVDYQDLSSDELTELLEVGSLNQEDEDHVVDILFLRDAAEQMGDRTTPHPDGIPADDVFREMGLR